MSWRIQQSKGSTRRKQHINSIKLNNLIWLVSWFVLIEGWAKWKLIEWNENKFEWRRNRAEWTKKLMKLIDLWMKRAQQQAINNQHQSTINNQCWISNWLSWFVELISWFGWLWAAERHFINNSIKSKETFNFIPLLNEMKRMNKIVL